MKKDNLSGKDGDSLKKYRLVKGTYGNMFLFCLQKKKGKRKMAKKVNIKDPSKGAEAIAQWLEEWDRRRGKAQKELEQMKARFASLPTVEEEINKVLESDGIDIEKGTNSFMKFMFGDENAIETGLNRKWERLQMMMDKVLDFCLRRCNERILQGC